MAEFLWEEPCGDCYIAALPDDVQQAPSASSAPTAAPWIYNGFVTETRSARWRKVRNAARRSASAVGGERRRRHQPKLRQETVSELKSSYDSENFQGKSVAPMFLDPRGNAMSVNSTGHLHHPCNLLSSWKWARLVESLLESATLGLRNPLKMRCRVVQRSYAKVNELA